MAKAIRTTSKNSEGAFEPFNIDDLPWQKLPGSDLFKRLGRYGGGTHVGVGIDVLARANTRTGSIITWPRRSTSSS
jgi:hypothetical protein